MTTAQFEPMGVGAILDRAFRIYRQNFVRFLAIVAIVEVPMMLVALLLTRVQVQAISTGEEGQVLSSAVILPTAFAGLVIMLVAQSLCGAVLMKSVSASYLGEQVTIVEAYKMILPKLLTLIGASIVVGLVVGVGMLLCLVPGIIFALWYMLTTEVIVIEGTGAFKGMSRSKSLVSGNLGKIFLLGLVVGILTWIIASGFSYVGGLIAESAVQIGDPQHIEAWRGSVMRAAVIRQFFMRVGRILVMPIPAAAYILLYYDLRIRKEGFDLEMLARALGRPAPAPPTPMPAAEMPPRPEEAPSDGAFPEE
jgi:hypothetical protein